jgi:hypothetical protein
VAAIIELNTTARIFGEVNMPFIQTFKLKMA